MSTSEFGWSFGPKLESSYTSTSLSGNKALSKGKCVPSRFAPQLRPNKRRYTNVPTITPTTAATISSDHIPESLRIKKKLNFKRVKNGDVSGKPLPVHRMIEIMDKQDMVDLLTRLVQEKPELNELIESSCKISLNVEKCISHLDTFLKERIISKLPFGVDFDSEYSFLRVEKNLIEFYQTLSDFILNYIPPAELNILNCLTFINDATHLLHKIPFFKINAYNMYHFTNIYEKLVASWWSILKFFTSAEANKEFNVYKMSEFDIIQHLDTHSRMSRCPDKFEPLIDFVKLIFANYSSEYSALSNSGTFEGDHCHDANADANGKQLLINEIMCNEESELMMFGNNGLYTTTSTTTKTFT